MKLRNAPCIFYDFLINIFSYVLRFLQPSPPPPSMLLALSSQTLKFIESFCFVFVHFSSCALTLTCCWGETEEIYIHLEINKLISLFRSESISVCYGVNKVLFLIVIHLFYSITCFEHINFLCSTPIWLSAVKIEVKKKKKLKKNFPQEYATMNENFPHTSR